MSTIHNARRRLQRDILELERTNIPSVAAKPLEDNLFEWHVNISPLQGIYSDIYLHLIMQFPDSYPFKPPTITICTPIHHPNVLGSFLCLSMLRENTGNHAYEGWSSSYSITSILMQLQSFLFAEKIEQDGGYVVDAELSASSITSSIKICQQFKCSKCGHSHSSPFPKVLKPQSVAIAPAMTTSNACKIRAIHTDKVSIPTSNVCQTADTQWVSAYAEIKLHGKGRKPPRIYYEATMTWTGSEYNRYNAGGGLARFGFGNHHAMIVGADHHSFGYGGTGKFSINNNYIPFGEAFSTHDTIICALDFAHREIYFGKNGQLLGPQHVLRIDNRLWEQDLYPMVTFKNCRIEFNFGQLSKPCPFLTKQGFVSVHEFCNRGISSKKAIPKTSVSVTTDNSEKKNAENDDDNDVDVDMEVAVDWHNEGIIDEIWLSIFESLEYDEIYCSKFVCKLWNRVITAFNIMERNQVACFFTKEDHRSNEVVLGIGLNIAVKHNRFRNAAPPVIQSQMDYLSLTAWRDGLRDGVWGEQLTHFLPLVINKKHSEFAHEEILQHLQVIEMLYQPVLSGAVKNDDERAALQLIDVVISMMNQLVVQFVMDNKEKNNNSNVGMIFCDKVVLGYCLFHHLLLYLVHYFQQQRKRKFITQYANKMVGGFLNSSNNGSHKHKVPDLGKFLIYSMLSDKYEWGDFAQTFMYEVMARNVLWIIRKYPQLNTTSSKYARERLSLSLDASLISRRLVMFQCWFMLNNKHCTLKQYNDRLGRPSQTLRAHIQRKTKSILCSHSWSDYMKQLHLKLENDDFHQLLLFAVARSYENKYHQCDQADLYIKTGIKPPKCFYVGDDDMDKHENSNSNSNQENDAVRMKRFAESTTTRPSFLPDDMESTSMQPQSINHGHNGYAPTRFGRAYGGMNNGGHPYAHNHHVRPAPMNGFAGQRPRSHRGSRYVHDNGGYQVTHYRSQQRSEIPPWSRRHRY